MSEFLKLSIKSEWNYWQLQNMKKTTKTEELIQENFLIFLKYVQYLKSEWWYSTMGG